MPPFNLIGNLFLQTITTGTTLILTDPRFNVEFEKSTSTYTLRIEDIQVFFLGYLDHKMTSRKFDLLPGIKKPISDMKI